MSELKDNKITKQQYGKKTSKAGAKKPKRSKAVEIMQGIAEIVDKPKQNK